MKIVILDNIRSVFNVGSIFRTSDALGVDKIYLCGTTPTPKDRFGRLRKDLAKVALGAEKNIEWEHYSLTKEAIKRLKKDGFQIIAVEQSKNSTDYRKITTGKKTAILVGNEVDGINKEILKLCDIIAEIPMKGKKESLNVEVAFAVAAYQIL